MPKSLVKHKVLKEVGAIFASDFTSDFVELSLNKTVDLIIATGEGTEGVTTIKVAAKLGENGTKEYISFKEKIGQNTFNNVEASGCEFTIGGTEGSTGVIVLTLEADKLKGKYDRIAVETTAVASSTVSGVIIATTYDPRYSD